MGYLEKYEPQMAKDLKLILKNIEEEKLAIQEQINGVKDRANQRMIEDGLQGVENIVKSEGGKIVVFNTEQELNDHIEKNRGKKGYTSEEINKMRKADGFQIGDIMFSNKKIFAKEGLKICLFDNIIKGDGLLKSTLEMKYSFFETLML